MLKVSLVEIGSSLANQLLDFNSVRCSEGILLLKKRKVYYLKIAEILMIKGL